MNAPNILHQAMSKKQSLLMSIILIIIVLDRNSHNTKGQHLTIKKLGVNNTKKIKMHPKWHYINTEM